MLLLRGKSIVVPGNEPQAQKNKIGKVKALNGFQLAEDIKSNASFCVNIIFRFCSFSFVMSMI